MFSSNVIYIYIDLSVVHIVVIVNVDTNFMRFVIFLINRYTRDILKNQFQSERKFFVLIPFALFGMSLSFIIFCNNECALRPDGMRRSFMYNVICIYSAL